MEANTINQEEQRAKIISNQRLFLDNVDYDLEYWGKMVELQRLKTQYYTLQAKQAQSLQKLAQLTYKKPDDKASNEGGQDNKG